MAAGLPAPAGGSSASGRAPVQELDDDPVGVADLEGAFPPVLRPQRHGDGDALGLQPGQLAVQVVHLEGEDELLDLMLDAAYQRMPRADTAGRPWRQRMAAVAAENRALFEAHPWAAAVSTVRPPLGPGLMAKYEHELSALDGLGLDDVEMDAALTYLLTFVQAWARAAADAQAARQDTATDDEQWWVAHAPLLQRVLDPGAYPLAIWVGTAAGTAHRAAYSPGHAYDFGLRATLDGLETLISKRR